MLVLPLAKPAWPGLVVLACLLAGCGASPDYETPALPPPPPPPPALEPTPLPEPYSQEGAPAPSASAEAATAPPPAPPAGPPPGPSVPAPPTNSGPPADPSTGSPLVYSYPTGSWTYLSGSGWVWVPAGATTEESEGVPYVYLYTPAYGWTWYVSPWGRGPYHYGLWVRHPWHPVGMHGYWVAHPHVVVRLGPRRFHR
jgi:hypothetical protein